MKSLGAKRPECANNAICFSGEVRDGAEFRKRLNENLEFTFRLPGGFDIVSSHPDHDCRLSLWIANPPLRAHHQTEIDTADDWTAEQEVEDSPRFFRFPQNCREFNALDDLVHTPLKVDASQSFTSLESLVKGHGRLWIEDAKTTHSHDSTVAGNGTIEWIKFSIEIYLK